MKKMLVKAVALSLVMGGVGFVANNAQAFSQIEEIQLKSKVEANHVRSMNNQDAITGLKGDVATNKANIQTNANHISDNNVAIQKEAAARKGDISFVKGMAGLEKQERENADKKLSDRIDANAKDIAANRDTAIKAYGMAQTEQVERKLADVQIREDMKKADDANKELATRALSTANKALIDGKIADVQIREDMKKADDANKELATRALSTANKALIDGKIADVQIREDMKKADAKEATTRENEDKKLQAQINKNGIKADTALQVIGNGVMYNHANNLTDGVNLNTKLIGDEAKARDDADKAEEAARKAEDQKLQANITNEAKTRENAVNALNSRIDQVGSDATKGIAKASALAALHPLDYDPDNKFDIAAAGGFYKGENAFALGAFYRPNRNVMLSMGTTLTSGDNAYNVGLTFKIGKSGKHTEAGLTTADLYAMIGAMQDKMDQQQKKIEELEAKQAK